MKAKKRVAIVGAGAAGMACAWSLSLHHTRFEVTVFEALESAGGVASTTMTADGRDRINDQVQGGAPSYRNNLLFFKQAADADPTDVHFKIAFGRGETAWSNHGPPSPLVERCSEDIKRFGRLLQRVHRHEWYYVFVPIHQLLERQGFSQEFMDSMVFPLVALFFGTGNQTPYVSAAVISRVFLDPELRLFEYDDSRLLSTVPTMFAFPPLGDIFAKITETIRSKGESHRVLTSAPVVKVERRRDGVSVFSPALEGGVEEFDDVVFACGAEQTLKILGDDASWRERTFLPNVKYYNDLIVTHEDTSYMDEHYQFDRRDDGDMYMIRVDPNNPKLIEMSFNLTMYQPHLRDGGKAKRDIYQSIFLDDSDTSGWTNGQIRGEKILYKRMTRQFAHRWQHFAFWVPFVRFLQGHRRTWHAGSQCLANTHEIAVMTGLAAADRLGAPYPFPEDKMAAGQYKTLFHIIHGVFSRMTPPLS